MAFGPITSCFSVEQDFTFVYIQCQIWVGKIAIIANFIKLFFSLHIFSKVSMMPFTLCGLKVKSNMALSTLRSKAITYVLQT